jgi:hypothetical protein
MILHRDVPGSLTLDVLERGRAVPSGYDELDTLPREPNSTNEAVVQGTDDRTKDSVLSDASPSTTREAGQDALCNLDTFRFGDTAHPCAATNLTRDIGPLPNGDGFGYNPYIDSAPRGCDVQNSESTLKKARNAAKDAEKKCLEKCPDLDRCRDLLGEAPRWYRGTTIVIGGIRSAKGKKDIKKGNNQGNE